MNLTTIHFITLMKDEKKWSQDISKIDRIIEELLRKNPEDPPEIRVLWAMSPKADKGLNLFYQALERPIIRMGLERSEQTACVKQIFPNEGIFEQESFLTKEEKIEIEKAQSEDKKTFGEIESALRKTLNILEKSGMQNKDFVKEVQNSLEKTQDYLKGIEGVVLGEAKAAVEKALNILKKSNPKNATELNSVNDSIKRALDILEDIKPLTLNKEDSEAYNTELELRGNEQALSNILVSSVAEKAPGVYINLDSFQLSETEKLLSDIVKNDDCIKRSNGYINYIQFKEENILSTGIFNSERNKRYKDLKEQAEKGKSFLYRALSFLKGILGVSQRKYQKYSVFNAYMKGHFTSELTAEGLVKDIQKQMQKPESFWKRLRNKISGIFTFTDQARLNKNFTQSEQSSVKKMQERLPTGPDITFPVLSEALKDLKDEHQKEGVEGVNYKKIASYFLDREGENLFAPYRAAFGKSGVNGKMEGWSPLHQAAKSKELAELLVERGAEVNIKNDSGIPPIFESASFGKVDVVEYLQEKGADIHAKDKDGNNILYNLVNEHRPGRDLTKMAEYLLERGLDPNEKNKSGRSTIDLAKEKRKYDLLELFEPSNLSVGIHNALSSDTKEFLKSALLESHLTSQTQVAQDEPGYVTITGQNEPDYATIDELGLSVEDFSKPPTPQAQAVQGEPDYVDIGQIRFKKEFDRLNRIDLENSKIDSGYASNNSLEQSQTSGRQDNLNRSSSSEHLREKTNDHRRNRHSVN